MKTVIVREIRQEGIPEEAIYTLDLETEVIKDCVGCWSCWQKTPGRCAYHDLDSFYRAYLQADKAIFYIGVSCDFVSGRVKTLFDRMIPHYLPYTSYKTGESMHVKRYGHYPDIDVYYQGDFTSPEAEKLFQEYLHRVFYQFHSKQISVMAIGAPTEKRVR